MKKVKFHSDQNITSLQEKEKENSMPLYNNKYKEAKKVNERKARKQFIYALKLFDTLVTPIYSIKLWGFSRSQKVGKNKPMQVNFYKFILSVKQSKADNFVCEELVRRPCQFMFRWKQVKFLNRLIGLSQCRFAHKSLQQQFIL